jgi:hypothetical protein
LVCALAASKDFLSIFLEMSAKILLILLDSISEEYAQNGCSRKTKYLFNATVSLFVI